MTHTQICNLFLKHATSMQTLARGEVLDNVDTVFLIRKGAVRVCLRGDSRELTHEFGLEGEFVANPFTFRPGEFSKYYLKALRKTSVIYMERSVFEDAAAQDPEFFRAFTQALEEVIARLVTKEMLLHEPDPGQRISMLMQSRPGIFQQVPMKYIAAYIGIAPETLSRQLSKTGAP